MSKKIFLLLTSFFLILSLSGCLPKQKNIIEEKPMPTKGGETVEKVLFVIAPVNFRDEEFQEPREVLENAGFQVVTASKGVQVAKGMLGATAKIDQDLSQVNVGDFVAVVFVGGSGASVYFNDPDALNLAREAVQQSRAVGAICIAPSILANAGVLQGKDATCFSSEAGNLQAKGANYTGQPVSVDGKIVTANGPGAAEEFGQKILEVLRGS